MRLVVFSPMIPESAIGRVSGLVIAALIGQGHHVTVVRSENDPYLAAPPRAVGAPIITWKDEQLVHDAAHAADAVVYQIGDHYGFHRGCIEWLPRQPGVVLLHDFFLGGLFSGWKRAHKEEADAVVRAWYGDAVAARYTNFTDVESLVANTADVAPMTEWITAMADGVLTHSSWGIDRVLRACAGPVQVAALPYDAPTVARTAGLVQPTSGTRPFTVLTVGHMNANKRVESVLQAIADSPRLRPRTLYRLVGQIQPNVRDRVSGLAHHLGVNLSIEGQVEDHALLAAFSESDVISCLRQPTLEAASASAIEAMLYGKAVLVMDAGFYHELPDDCVAKVSASREVADVRGILEQLEADPEGRLALGRRAAKFAARTFRADSYARSLIDLCHRAASAAPILEAVRSYASTLLDWDSTGSTLAIPDIIEPLRIFETASHGARSRE